ncbi:HXXEE domain-containing protein [Nonomuraea sp. NPDC049400]|uniref:HXXEE domain-containing protein n=1 Tax=Nonomuraea sp. NPDC049400 TaxID=3364352 RepID=UPI0037B6DFAF
MVPSTVTWGLLVAWAVHDAEELATIAGWARKARERWPWVPEVSQGHVNVAIGLMGGVVAGASALGARTGGRSPVFQAALLGFGAHGVVHLGQAAVARGYTPGVVTAPLVVIPFSVWAWRRLRAAGVPVRTGASGWAGPAAFPLVVGGVHALAHALTRPRAHGTGTATAPAPARTPAPRVGAALVRALTAAPAGMGWWGRRRRSRFRRERWF